MEEAEYVALARLPARESAQALARDLGWEMRPIINVDSSTARSIAKRTGVGKLRDRDEGSVGPAGLQGSRFSLCTAAGKENAADILTKPMSVDEMQVKLRGIGAVVHVRGEPERQRWADHSLS